MACSSCGKGGYKSAMRSSMSSRTPRPMRSGNRMPRARVNTSGPTPVEAPQPAEGTLTPPKNEAIDASTGMPIAVIMGTQKNALGDTET